jgi:hypothetical protein
MAQLARSYLSRCRNAALHHFLRLSFAQLQHRHGSVVSVVVPRPKLIPVRLHKPEAQAKEQRAVSFACASDLCVPGPLAQVSRIQGVSDARKM